MICPNCHAEMKEGTRFCVKCGTKLEQPPQPVFPKFCIKCGAPLREGVKFCTKCGSKVEPVTPQGESFTFAPQESEAVLPPQGSEAVIPPQGNKTVVYPQGNAKLPPLSPQYDTGDALPAPKKSKAPLFFLVFVLLLVIAAGAFFALVILPAMQGKENFISPYLPAFLKTAAQEETGSSEEETEEKKESAETPEESKSEAEESKAEETVDIAALLAPINALAESGKEALADGRYIDEDGGLTILADAMEQYAQLVQKYGVNAETEASVRNAFAAYRSGLQEHYNMLYEQEVSSALYEQLTSELEACSEVAASLRENGLDVDESLVAQLLKEFPEKYKERYILKFNEFADRENWSRSEAWALMEDAEKAELFDKGEQDDPLRLRWCYAKAMITRKENENAIADGSMSLEEAAKKCMDMLAETDYNPALIHDAYRYAAEGRLSSAREYGDLYDTLMERMKEMQGTSASYGKVNTGIDIDHFWYFSDPDDTKYRVDETNGATHDVREWIRDYMSDLGY